MLIFLFFGGGGSFVHYPIYKISLSTLDVNNLNPNVKYFFEHALTTLSDLFKLFSVFWGAEPLCECMSEAIARKTVV